MSRQPSKLFKLLSAERPDWDAVVDHLRDNPDDASYVDQETLRTPLHWALLAPHTSGARTTSARQRRSGEDSPVRASSSPPPSSSLIEQRRRVIKTLLALHPGATSVRCRARGYTPLAVACRTACLDSIAEDAKVIRSLLMANHRPANILCHRGYSPLIVHIKACSRLLFQEAARTRRNREGSVSCPGNENCEQDTKVISTAVLDILARFSNQSQLEQALETVCQSNSLLILNLISREAACARKDMIMYGLKEARASSYLSGLWIWEWLLIILQHVSNRLDDKPRGYLGEFYPLHVASRIAGCPPPVVLLCLRAYPQDARTVLDPKSLSLPHHQVASWTAAPQPPATERSSASFSRTDRSASTNCRKFMLLKAIESEHPPGMNARNCQGRTPLEVAAESSAGAP